MLALHNLEEYRQLARETDGNLPFHHAVDLQTVTSAMRLLTACSLPLMLPQSRLTKIRQAALFALFLNSLGHIGSTLRRKRMTPGARSAVLLVLPYTIAELRKLAHQLPAKRLLRRAVAGAFLLPAVTTAALIMGRPGRSPSG